MIPEKNANLQNRNTLAAPCVAEFFYKAKTQQCVAEAVAWAASKKHPLSILGGGSNVLLDEKIPGLVLAPCIKGLHITTLDAEWHLVEAGAGEDWDEFVQYCLAHKLYGLENLSLIPGLVGACPIQNIGAYGVEVGSLIECVKVYDRKFNTVAVLRASECEFGYRTSIFKTTQKHRYIVLSVTFRLSSIAAPKIDYPALRASFDGNDAKITAELVARTVKEIRNSKIPLPNVIPNAGSFFKNPVVAAPILDNLKQQFTNVPAYPAGEGQVKLAAGWLIEQAGWKGETKFGVAMHKHQALILTNPNKKPLATILQFAGCVQADVLRQFNVSLEIEPQRLL